MAYTEPDYPRIFRHSAFLFKKSNRTFVRPEFFFRFFNFQTEKNPAVKLSVQNFFGFNISRPKKFGFSDSGAGSVSKDLRRQRELVNKLTSFFQRSLQFFWDFQLSTGKLFSFSNFGPENFSRKKISDRAGGTRSAMVCISGCGGISRDRKIREGLPEMSGSCGCPAQMWQRIHRMAEGWSEKSGIWLQGLGKIPGHIYRPVSFVDKGHQAPALVLHFQRQRYIIARMCRHLISIAW